MDDDGILNFQIHAVARTLENTKAHLAEIKQILKGRKCYALGWTTEAADMAADAKAYYKKIFPDFFHAVAFVSELPAGRSAGRLYSLVLHPSVPINVFHDEKEAREWLKELMATIGWSRETRKEMKRIKGKIVMVDDEEIEKMLMEIALENARWDVSLEFFTNAKDALNYLRQTKDHIFLIISDLGMPVMDGFEFKQAIDADPVLARMSVPFVITTNSDYESDVSKAYKCRVQGYFHKPISNDDAISMLNSMFNYWLVSRHPNKSN
jgi:CheY-like chemotaxis protein